MKTSQTIILLSLCTTLSWADGKEGGGGNARAAEYQTHFREELVRLLSVTKKQESKDLFTRVLGYSEKTRVYCGDKKDLKRARSVSTSLDKRYSAQSDLHLGYLPTGGLLVSCYESLSPTYLWELAAGIYFYLRANYVKDSEADAWVQRLKLDEAFLGPEYQHVKTFQVNLARRLRDLDPCSLPSDLDIKKLADTVDSIKIEFSRFARTEPVKKNWNGFGGMFWYETYFVDRGYLDSSSDNSNSLYNRYLKKLLVVGNPRTSLKFLLDERSWVFWALMTDEYSREIALNRTQKVSNILFNLGKKGQKVKTFGKGPEVIISSPEKDPITISILKSFETLILDAVASVGSLPSSWTPEKLTKLTNALKLQNIELVRKKGIIPTSLQASSNRTTMTTQVSLVRSNEAVSTSDSSIALYLHELCVLAGIEEDGLYSDSSELASFVLKMAGAYLKQGLKHLNDEKVLSICQPFVDKIKEGIQTLAEKDADFGNLVRNGKVSLKWPVDSVDMNWNYPNCAVKVFLESDDFDFQEISTKIPEQLATGFRTAGKEKCEEELSRKISSIQNTGFVGGTAIIAWEKDFTYDPGFLGRAGNCSSDKIHFLAISKESR